MEMKVHKKENVLFMVKVFFTIIIFCIVGVWIKSFSGKSDTSYTAIITLVITYAVMIFIFVIFQKIYMVAYLKGNGIQISEDQFPEIYSEYLKMANELGMKKVPTLFLTQQGGMLNAFAIRFSGRNYIAIYSDIFSLISTDIDAVKFVLGHELGHVKRHHMSKRFWTFPSSIIPFLTAAYSRSCEYTCDNIGNEFTSNNSLNGLLVLAAGKELYKKINIDSYIKNAKNNNSISVKLIGLCLSHPYLPCRLENLKK
jgi:Zn-dependent protease with chaperone function